jgi:hypothetical protein
MLRAGNRVSTLWKLLFLEVENPGSISAYARHDPHHGVARDEEYKFDRFPGFDSPPHGANKFVFYLSTRRVGTI